MNNSFDFLKRDCIKDDDETTYSSTRDETRIGAEGTTERAAVCLLLIEEAFFLDGKESEITIGARSRHFCRWRVVAEGDAHDIGAMSLKLPHPSTACRVPEDQ